MGINNRALTNFSDFATFSKVRWHEAGLWRAPNEPINWNDIMKNSLNASRLFFFAIFLQVICGNTMLNSNESKKTASMLIDIQTNRHSDEILSQILPIVRCSFQATKCENLLMTKLRDVNTSMPEFRKISDQLAGLLAVKVIENLPIAPLEINTPLTQYTGITIASNINLVSVMRSGDALLDTFTSFFPQAPINKILVQRDETTAEPHFKYMKLSPTLGPDSIVIITEPMLATGGTLCMVVSLLKERGVPEENFIIACICTAPEGLLVLNKKFPKINVVMIVMDEKLNERKYIVPGIGDFGDRYFGTVN